MCPSPKSFPKPIVFTDRFGPNFLWHMLAVAKIGYESPYAKRYAKTVAGAQLALLEENRDLLKFGSGEGSPLAGFFIFLPAWLHIETKEEFDKYFRTVGQALNEADFRVFLNAYPDADWSDKFLAAEAEHATFPPNHRELARRAASLAWAYLESYDRYAENVWPEAKQAMQPRLGDLNNYFSELDYIAEWETLLGKPFDSPQFELVLCFANENGPDYNSLGYSGNLFFYDKPFEMTCQWVSHEIGTHLLFDDYMKLALGGKYEHAQLYRSMETLAKFYNHIILGTNELEYSISKSGDQQLLDTYAAHYGEDVAPAALLKAALT